MFNLARALPAPILSHANTAATVPAGQWFVAASRTRNGHATMVVVLDVALTVAVAVAVAVAVSRTVTVSVVVAVVVVAVTKDVVKSSGWSLWPLPLLLL